MAAFLAALLAALAIGIVIRMAESVLNVGLGFIPLVTIIACLVTIRVRSLWPVVGMFALVIGFLLYAVVVNVDPYTRGSQIVIRLYIGWTVFLTGQIAIGAIAGWLWYRRESRLARPPRSA